MSWMPRLHHTGGGVFVWCVRQDRLVVKQATRPPRNAAGRLWCASHTSIATPISGWWVESNAAVHRVVAAGAADAKLVGLEGLPSVSEWLCWVELGPVRLVHPGCLTLQVGVVRW